MNYSGIIVDDFADGLDVRVALYVSGCDFHCNGCHNQDAQSFDFGFPYTDDTYHKLIDLISQPFVAGLSILGGDPLCQSIDGMAQLTELCKVAKEMNKNVWIWSGYTWEQIFPEVVTNELNIKRIAQQTLVKSCDVFVDGRYEDDKRDLTLAFRGSSNQRIIDVNKSLEQKRVVLIKE